MADLSITPADVGVAGAGKVTVGVAGGAIARGEVVYLDGADSKYKLADNGAAATAAAIGIAQSPAAGDGDYIVVSKTGNIVVGATVVAGQMYYVSSNAGKIAPYADLGSTEFVTSVFRGISTTEATLDFDNTGIQIA